MKMNGNEQSKLNVFLGENKVAELVLMNDKLEWRYDSEWIQKGFAISPHLPLHDEVPSLNVRRFLRNLLPEGDGLEELIANFHLSRTNTFGLIRALGMDTPGALVILDDLEHYPEESLFRPINFQELEGRLNNRDQYSLVVWDNKPRLSVAGIQDKINIVVNEEQQFGFGDGRLCSTHILKFEKQKISNLVLNEYISISLAQRCQLDVAETRMLKFGKNPALLVKRFDRKLIKTDEVKRRHVIDGCQALNLPPDYKYERNFGSGRDVAHIRDGASLNQLFTFAERCENPAVTKQKLLDWVIFNILIFNSDAHGKNISFFVGKKGISLAPFYDLVNIKMYPEFETSLSMAIGDEFDSNSINAYQLADFSEQCGIQRTLVASRLNRMLVLMKEALDNINILGLNDSTEIKYFSKYKKIVSKQCAHLAQQVEEVKNIKL